ncbi:MAG: NAD(P)/FAD-dependent oxidoreductase [Candidatus Rokuibacteriota bacterium]
MSGVREAGVVVVGGGIWGCSIAHQLARAGVSDVLVLERRELASGNTPQAAGLVGQLRSSELMCRAIQGVVRRLTGWSREHGEDSGFRQVGSLKLALTDVRVAELERHVARARGWGLEVEVISPKAAQERVPFLDAAAVRAAAWIPGDGYVEPYTLAMAIARAARARGVRFETQRPVTRITVREGAVRGVETPGGPVAAERVVVAAGPWVERVGEAIGLRFDTVPLRHQHWTTAPMETVPRDLPVVRVPDASVYIRPEVGGLMLGGFEARPKAFPMADLPAAFEIEHTEQDLGVLDELAGGLTRAFPPLASAPVLKGCAGLPTFTPDGQYLIGEVPTVRGLFVAAGCNAIGIAGSLLIGDWTTELVLEGRTRADTASQALTRFGSRYAGGRRLQDACESIYGNFYSLDKGAF